MQLYLDIAQIIISVALVAIILLQSRRGDLGGSVFGGSGGAIYQKRRGLERTIFNVTVVLSIVFFLLTLANVMVTG
ncbi:MAG: preprotein translocase subunit SecG [Anaerolineae bacterium]|nr:preprotein translocase subunit SecG [Chloroflexota bacterium]